MAFFKTMTQGGQVHIHQLHMLKQVIVIGLMVAFVIGFSWFGWKSYSLPSYGWYVLSQTSWARFMLATTPAAQHPSLYQEYIPLREFPLKGSPLKGNPVVGNNRFQGDKPYRRSCLNILKDPFLQKTTQQMEARLKQAAYGGLWAAIAGFLAVMALWFYMGRHQQKTEHRRGSTLVPWRKLANMIKTENQASDLVFGELPFLKHKETSHTLITGTTGAGKTNSFHHLLPQIRKRGDRAIILDVTGDYIARYYNKETDIILNPLDKRSVPWHPWADCLMDSHYDVLAESLIQPKAGHHDPFWDKASRVILKTALRKYAYQQKDNVEELTKFLMSSSDKEFERFFKGTEAASFASSKNDKTTHSIRSVLASQIDGLRHLESSKSEPKENEENKEGQYIENGQDKERVINENGENNEETKTQNCEHQNVAAIEQELPSPPEDLTQKLALLEGKEEKSEQALDSRLDQKVDSKSDPKSERKPEPSFSIRKWIMGDPSFLSKSSEKQESDKVDPTQQKSNNGWLFITVRADQRQSLTPLISAWMDIAINALMVLPEDYRRRLWFVLDELAALQNLPSLGRGLAEGRKYGGCFLAGFQSKPQLEEIYGRSAAETMLDLFNTKVFFRCTEPTTQNWISKVLGDKEETEPQENISYGANSMRDGVSLSQQTRQKPLVMPAEFSQLKDLECYVKLPGDMPCTKLQMTFQTHPESDVPAFLLKPEKKREYPAYEFPIEEEISKEEKEY